MPSPSSPDGGRAFLSLVDRLPDSVICLDRAFRITYANAQARRVSRINSIDLNNRTHWEMFPETVGTEVERVYREVMESRVPGHIEHFYAPFNLWIDVHVVPIPDGIALSYHDVTDRKRAEAQRDEAVSRLQQVLENSPDSIICIDHDWNCTFANRAARIILKSDELVGANLWTAYPLNQEEPFASNYRATMERGIPTEFEAWYPAPLNIWFKVSARPYEDGIIIFSSDITTRKKAEGRRDAITRRLEQAFAATTDGVLSISRDWTFTFLNRRAEELLAIKGDLIGRNLWEEFPATRDSVFHTHYNTTMLERSPTQFEAYYPDPLNMWLKVVCQPSDDGMVVFFSDVTAQRSAHQALLNQQDTLAFVQKSARIATWQLDLATGVMTFDPGSWPVLGHPPSSIRNLEDFNRVLHPKDRERVQQAAQLAIDTHAVTTVDYQVIAEDGRLLWVEGRRLAIYDGNGRPTHIRGTSIDISDRKRNEERLAASEERYRVLADLNPQAIWMGGPDGKITYANQGFLDYIGLTMEEASDHLTWLNTFAEEDRSRVLQAWTHSIATGEEYEVEAHMIRASDRAIRWWWLRALPIHDEAGRILNWLGVAIDIHDRKTHADQLQAKNFETERQRMELETIYTTAPIGLALFDPVEFRYLRLNDRQAAFFNLAPDQVLGRTLTEMAPIPGLREMFEQVARGIPVTNQLLEGELATDPGEHRYWTVNYYPVHGPDGKVQAISAASLEITHQKKAELALIQSEKLAAVGRLASSISHEINNPLEAITNILYLIERDPSLTAEVKPLVNMAQSELARVCQIATQTLRFHRQAVRATHVTAENLVGAVLDLYQGRLSNTGISVEVAYASATPILCFENDIRQVLNNLIANAIDAMRQHGGHLLVRAHDTTIKTVPGHVGRPGVRITIADTGHGMSQQVRNRIFEPFFTTKDLNGTGLGLWISAGIVDRHKGRVLVRTSTHPVHHGTVFSLILPTEDEPTHLQN